MKTFATFAAVAVLASGFAMPGFAQSLAPAAVMVGHTMSTQKLIGTAVYNDEGTKIGSIVDVLVKDAASAPVAILSVGDFVGGGSKLVAVPLDHVTMGGGKPMMHGATKAALAGMPTFLFPAAVGGAG